MVSVCGMLECTLCCYVLLLFSMTDMVVLYTGGCEVNSGKFVMHVSVCEEWVIL